MSKSSTKDPIKNPTQGFSLKVVRTLNLVCCYIVALLIRAWLISENSFGLSERVELATPLNSYKRLTEGVTLLKQGVDPYSGVLFHETPLILHAFNWIQDNLNDRRINALFMFLDAFTAIVLGHAANLLSRYLLKQEDKNRKSFHQDAENIILKVADFQSIERYAQLAYLFHPYIIANCAAKTTTVFSNLVLACFLVCMLKKWRLLSTLWLALATYQSFYPIMLLFPLWAMMSHGKQMKLQDVVVKEVLPSCGLFLGWFFAINYASFILMGESLNFLSSTHGFILSVPELTPNMGLFWYFFTEMFEHFRLFFVCTFQINCFIYVIPLTIRFRNEPFLLAFTLLGLTAIFKSYPSYGEVGFYTALLPTVASHLVPYMKQTFIIANMFLATTMLGPIQYQLWIFNGSANANYFFAITLVFGTAQIFLLTDILFAHVKREFYLFNGYKALKPSKAGNSEEARLILK